MVFFHELDQIVAVLVDQEAHGTAVGKVPEYGAQDVPLAERDFESGQLNRISRFVELLSLWATP